MSMDTIPVRLSHLLRHCSVGAIVRGPDYLMTVVDIRYWTARDGSPAGQLITYVDQVRSALGIEQELRTPPTAKELDNGQLQGVCVPSLRFPAWMRCPACGLLHYKPWKNTAPGKRLRCLETDRKRCSKPAELEQVSSVLVHADGHLAEVPWHFIAHREGKSRSQQQCRADWATPYLRIDERSVSRRRIICGRCRAAGEFPDQLRISFGTTWRQPWVAETVEAHEMAVILEVNDARVHTANTASALIIPPESRISKGSIVDRLYSSTEKRQQLERARTSLAQKAALQTIASEFGCSVSEVEMAQQQIEAGYPLYGENITPGLLLESEYQALIEEIPDLADDEDFVTVHHTLAWQQLASDSPARRIAQAVRQLIAVHRLKEIMVLRDFQRLDGARVPPDIVGESSWLPALELYGEGIFFTLDEEALQQWEANAALRERAVAFARRFAASDLHFDPEIIVSPRFILLHTLAHVLIRQLETEAGYPAAALKERIYCTAGGIPMCGILIYVAVPDVVGSLGGLTELAEPKRFLPLLYNVFNHADWCSLDPVCSEHEGQGPHLLNRAACHGCALIPETSCAYGNILLDRVFIKGDRSMAIPSYLDCTH